jgi:hypothetical protein
MHMAHAVGFGAPAVGFPSRMMVSNGPRFGDTHGPRFGDTHGPRFGDMGRGMPMRGRGGAPSRYCTFSRIAQG